MDPVTHAIVGGTMGYLCCGHKLGRQAAAVGMLAGITPDIDHFISSETDPLLYVEYHRYFTHSLLFAFAGAGLAILPWMMRRGFRERWLTLWLCAFPAYLSHCLLDACTTWGTQLYWPFARTRVSWDIIAIVDPLFTIVLGTMLVFALVRRLPAAAAGAVGFALVYLSFGAVQHGRAAAVQRRAAAERGHVIERSEVMPTLANNVVWRSIYLAQGQIYSDRVRVGWFSTGMIRDGGALPLLKKEQLRPAERAGNEQHRGFDRFAWFTDGWVARALADESIIGDMRYSRSTEAFDPVWGIRLTNRNGRASIEWVSRERERRLNISQLWDEISGRDARFRRMED